MPLVITFVAATGSKGESGSFQRWQIFTFGNAPVPPFPRWPVYFPQLEVRGENWSVSQSPLDLETAREVTGWCEASLNCMGAHVSVVTCSCLCACTGELYLMFRVRSDPVAVSRHCGFMVCLLRAFLVISFENSMRCFCNQERNNKCFLFPRLTLDQLTVPHCLLLHHRKACCFTDIRFLLSLCFLFVFHYTQM